MYNTYTVGTKDFFQEEIRQSEIKKRILYNALENLFSKGDPDDALKDGNMIDHDDSLAINPNIKEFGLLLHGIQAKDSDAAKALKRMREENIEYSYHSK